MIELAPGAGSVEEADGPAGVLAGRESLGSVALRGEIVDSKCYLGAMRPGDGKAHRACAQLCIAGGLPPMLVATGPASGPEYYMLTTDEGGMANALVRPFVAEPVEVTGTAERLGDLLFLRVDPGGIRRR